MNGGDVCLGRFPIILVPSAKDYLWGGSRLNDDFGLSIDISPLAEVWVCSTHRDGDSYLTNGITLREYLAKHPDYLGTHSLQITNGLPELPILIKLIDANKDLSVQVHPDDVFALRNENSLGKTEMWYILDAAPNSSLIYGFREDTTPDDVRFAIKNATISNLLNHVPIHKNDVFFVEAGTVHAIGAGALLVEIQESSNVTYRLYDYDRTDIHGNVRPLHIDKALKVANLKSSVVPRQPMRVLKYKKGMASELLTSCKYFRVERILLNTEVNRSLVEFRTESNSFQALLCIEGCGCLSWEDNERVNNHDSIGSMNFFKGDCIFIPADSDVIKLHGNAQFLKVSC